MTPKKRPVAVARGWAFADPARRTFLALNRAGDSYHYVSPAEPDDRRVADGLVVAGALVCTCEGGRFRGSCYQVTAAQKLLDTFQAGTSYPALEERWFDAPATPAEGVA